MLDEASRNDLASGIVTDMVETWSADVAGLPAVCAAGEQCRVDAFNSALLEISEDWSQTLKQIDDLITSSIS